MSDSGITPRWYRRTGATVLARGLSVDAAATFLGHTNSAGQAAAAISCKLGYIGRR